MWGRPASPRPAGLGMPPRVHRLLDSGSDYLLDSVGSWLRLASLWPISASGFAETLLYSCAFSREVGCRNIFDLGLSCGSLDGC